MLAKKNGVKSKKNGVKMCKAPNLFVSSIVIIGISPRMRGDPENHPAS